MPFDLSLAIDVLLPVCQTAYAAMSIPPAALALPSGYAVVGLIQANPTAAALAMHAAPAEQQHPVTGMLSDSSTWGIVAWNGSTQTALVAIRGTKTIWEWIEDVTAVPTPFFPDWTAGDVHLGFQLCYLHCRDSLLTLLGQIEPTRLLITGHSLGGALATYLALDVLLHKPTRPITPELMTFGSPRPGGLNFKTTFVGAVPNYARVVNWLDVVPDVPTWPSFRHCGEETLVHGPWKLSPSYRHSLTTYLSGLQKLKE